MLKTIFVCLLTLVLFACTTSDPLETTPQPDSSTLTETEVISLVKEKITADYEVTSSSDDLFDKVSCGVLVDRDHMNTNSFEVTYQGDGIWLVTLPAYKLDIKRTATYSWQVSEVDSSVISTGFIDSPDWVETETRKVC